MLIIWILRSLNLEILRVTFQVLGEDLLQVFVEFLSVLIFRKMFLIILNQFLYLLLQLLIRYNILRRGIVLLTLVLVGHTSRIVTPLVHLLVAANIRRLAQRLPIVVTAGYPVVLVVHTVVLSLKLLVQLRLQTCLNVVIRCLLDHTASVRVSSVGCGPLNEVLSHRLLLVLQLL